MAEAGTIALAGLSKPKKPVVARKQPVLEPEPSAELDMAEDGTLTGDCLPGDCLEQAFALLEVRGARPRPRAGRPRGACSCPALGMPGRCCCSKPGPTRAGHRALGPTCATAAAAAPARPTDLPHPSSPPSTPQVADLAAAGSVCHEWRVLAAAADAPWRRAFLEKFGEAKAAEVASLRTWRDKYM